jgi:hypothetical protein
MRWLVTCCQFRFPVIDVERSFGDPSPELWHQRALMLGIP